MEKINYRGFLRQRPEWMLQAIDQYGFHEDETVERWLQRVENDDPEVGNQLRQFVLQNDREAEDKVKAEYYSRGVVRAMQPFVADAFPEELALLAVTPRGRTFSNFKPVNDQLLDAYNAVWAWTERANKPMMVLAGLPGVGKTHLLRAAGVKLEDAHEQVAYIDEAALIAMAANHMRLPGGWQEFVEGLGTASWLLIDDVGTQPYNSWSRGVMDRLVHIRNERAFGPGFRTMLTTNREARDLPQRMTSRLMDSQVSVVVSFDGVEDYRRTRR